MDRTQYMTDDPGASNNNNTSDEKRRKKFEPLEFDIKLSNRKPNQVSSKPLLSEEKLGPPEIEPHEIQLIRELGKGAFGVVFEGTCRNKQVAVKVLPHMTEQETAEFKKEITVMRKLFHPNIVLCLGGCTKKGDYKIVMEKCEMTLEKRLAIDKKRQMQKKDSILTITERIKIAKDVALGMDWLHGICGLVHKDLKTANVLLEGGTAKISDFGFSYMRRSAIQRDFELQGTPVYMAPEMLARQEYDGFKTDVYAFALILWEIITSEVPFKEFTELRPFRAAVVEQHLRPPIPPNTPECLVLLLNRCWDADPQKRPTFTEIAFRLDEALVEVTIADQVAKDFWKRYFLKPTQRLETEAPWSSFRHILFKNRIPFDLIDGASPLLSEVEGLLSSNARKVKMETFSALVQTWGRFFLEGGGPILEQMIEYMETPGCYDFSCTREKAQAKLADSKPGTYLVRMRDPSDASHPGKPFSISYVTESHGERKINHKLVAHDPTNGVMDYNCNGHHKSIKDMIAADPETYKNPYREPESPLKFYERGYQVDDDEKAKAEDLANQLAANLHI